MVTQGYATSPPSRTFLPVFFFVQACARCRAGCIILTSFQVFTWSVYNFGFRLLAFTFLSFRLPALSPVLVLYFLLLIFSFIYLEFLVAVLLLCAVDCCQLLLLLLFQFLFLVLLLLCTFFGYLSSSVCRRVFMAHLIGYFHILGVDFASDCCRLGRRRILQ